MALNNTINAARPKCAHLTSIILAAAPVNGVAPLLEPDPELEPDVGAGAPEAEGVEPAGKPVKLAMG